MRTSTLITGGLIFCFSSALLIFLKYDELFVLPDARRSIAGKLNDPASAEFRNDRVLPNGWHCGEVNAKNEFGGYVGFKRFVSGGKNGIVYLEGHGMLGKESTEEAVLILKSATEKMVAFNRIVESGVQVNRPTKEEFLTRARNDVFESHWKDLCSAMAQ